MGIVLRLVNRTTIRLVVKARRIQGIKQSATPQFSPWPKVFSWLLKL